MRLPASGPARAPSQTGSALLLLAFVLLVALAFWAGAVWIGQSLLALTAV